MSRLLGNLARWLGRVPAGWWVAIAIVPALVPLVHGGFFESADGRLHLDRLAALDQAVRAGVLLPRWFPDLAFGYGHPVLNFYGPLSYYLALPFTLLGVSPIVALKLVFAAAVAGSGLGMLLLARQHSNAAPRWLPLLFMSTFPITCWTFTCAAPSPRC